MSVTFGTPVSSGYTGTTIALSGVTAGQPILLALFGTTSPTVSDNFLIPYTWTLVDSESLGFVNAIYIGTGGYGTSGTITTTNVLIGSLAVPCVGASGAGGLAAIDVHSNSTGSNLTISSPSLTPGATGEGAFYVGIAANYTNFMVISGSPSTPWTSTYMAVTGANVFSVSTYPSPPASALSTTWTQTGVNTPTYGAIAAIIKAFAATAPSAPTLTAPTTASQQNGANPVTFSATYNPTDNVAQSAYALRVKAGAGSYQYWNAGTTSLQGTIVWNTDSVNPSASWSVTLPATNFVESTVYSWSFASQESGASVQGAFATDSTFTPVAVATGGLVASFNAAAAPITIVYTTGDGLVAAYSNTIATSAGSAPADIVPYMLPVAINDHPYMMDFAKSRITTMQIRRVSADDSVEPGEQTLSASGVWPRAQDNYFLGAGQEFLDNRFAFESVYIHSGEAPSIRTRFKSSFGVNPWVEGKLTLQPEYASIATSTSNLVIVACGNYLYKTNGATLSWTLNPVGTASPSWTNVTSANTNNIVSLTSDGSRVWFATGSQGVYVTTGGSATSATASTPAALNGIGGLLAYAAGAGTVNATNLPNGSTTWYVSEVDAFGNETAAVSVVLTVASLPVNLNWNPDTNATSFNVYRGTNTLVYSGDVPSFVDDGTVVGSTKAHPTTNGTGVTAYPATFITYNKGHLLGSTGRDLVEILANGSASFIYQHENPYFAWTCATECPSAILVGGYAGNVSFVGAIQPDAATNGATLAPPTWATTMTNGEQINDIQYDAGAILMGTSLGIRSGTKPDSNGTFDVDPVIQAPGSVLCVSSWGQYMYFGWSNFVAAEPWASTRPTVSGLGRADLSQYTNPGIPAYATDVMGATVGTTNQVLLINAVPYFVVLNAGTYTLYGPDNKVVPSGWIEPGWVRYGTLESKILVEIDFQHEPLPSGGSVNYQVVLEDKSTVVNIGTNSVALSTTIKTPLPAGLMVGDRFLPIITLTAPSNQASGPVFLSHVTKAMVTTKRQDEVLLALVWADQVRSIGPAAKTWDQDCFAEYFYLKGYEATGQVITLTMGGNVRTAFIDQVMLEPNNEMTSNRQWFMGTVTVKMITLS